MYTKTDVRIRCGNHLSGILCAFLLRSFAAFTVRTFVLIIVSRGGIINKIESGCAGMTVHGSWRTVRGRVKQNRDKTDIITKISFCMEVRYGQGILDLVSG